MGPGHWPRHARGSHGAAAATWGGFRVYRNCIGFGSLSFERKFLVLICPKLGLVQGAALRLNGGLGGKPRAGTGVLGGACQSPKP